MIDVGTISGVAIILAFMISVIASFENDKFAIPAILFGVASLTSFLLPVMCGSITKFLIIGSLSSLAIDSHHSPSEKNGRDTFHIAGYYAILLSLVVLLVNILIWMWILTDVATNFGDAFSDWWWGGSADFFENSQEAMLASEISKLASAILCPIGILLLFRSNSFHAESPQLS